MDVNSLENSRAFRVRLNKSVLFGVFVLFGVAASANPVFWSLNNVTFGDGTVVTGSFTVDADTSAFTGLSLTTSGGSSVPAESNWFFAPGDTYNQSGTAGFLAVDSQAADLTGAFLLSLFVVDGSTFTNAGGTLNLGFMIAGTCGDSACSTVNPDLANSTSGAGQFVSGEVPEPSTFILGGSVLLLGGLRRKFAGKVR
jgi:hypothetical protein